MRETDPSDTNYQADQYFEFRTTEYVRLLKLFTCKRNSVMNYIQLKNAKKR